jgi:DNA repair protein RadC
MHCRANIPETIPANKSFQLFKPLKPPRFRSGYFYFQSRAESGGKESNMKVCEITESERPQYRIESHGTAALSAIELVQVVTGASDMGTIAGLLGEGGLSGISGSTPVELARKGLTRTQAKKLLAAIELGRRIVSERGDKRKIINTAADLGDLMVGKLSGLLQEEVHIICMDVKLGVIGTHMVTRGTGNASIVTPCEIFRPAIACGSGRVALAHNHPSGNPEPSKDDMALTKRIAEAGALLGIDLIDHIVVGKGEMRSIRGEHPELFPK